MLGIDIVKNDRIKESLFKFGNHFLSKVYTPYEIELCGGMNIECLAGRFASKEASIKAFYSAFHIKTYLKDFEIQRDNEGMPCLNILNKTLLHILELKKMKAFLSISHEKEYTVAVCYITKEEAYDSGL